MKGSLEGVLPMLGLLVLAVTLATQSIPISDALSEVVSGSTSDIERVVETRAFGDFYFYNYVPQAGEYSVNDAAHELAPRGGGLTWDNTMLDSASNELYNIWRENSTKKLNERIEASTGKCSVEDVNYTASPFGFINVRDTKIGTLASYTQEEDKTPLTVRCSYSEGNTFYRDDEDIYSTTINATSNRYLQIADRSEKLLQKLRTELNKISQETGYSPWTCNVDDSDRTTATNNALNPLESQIENAVNEAHKEVEPLPAGLEKKSEIVSFHTFNYGNPVNTDKFEGSINGRTVSKPNGCGPSNNQPEYRAKATITPDVMELNLNMTDKSYDIIVKGSYENLEFKVEPYTHYW